jgi:hypothetical protein
MGKNLIKTADMKIIVPKGQNRVGFGLYLPADKAEQFKKRLDAHGIKPGTLLRMLVEKVISGEIELEGKGTKKK